MKPDLYEALRQLRAHMHDSSTTEENIIDELMEIKAHYTNAEIYAAIDVIIGETK